MWPPFHFRRVWDYTAVKQYYISKYMLYKEDLFETSVENKVIQQINKIIR